MDFDYVDMYIEAGILLKTRKGEIYFDTYIHNNQGSRHCKNLLSIHDIETYFIIYFIMQVDI